MFDKIRFEADQLVFKVLDLLTESERSFRAPKAHEHRRRRSDRTKRALIRSYKKYIYITNGAHLY